MSEEFKVGVGVSLNDSKLDELDRRLEKLKTTPVPIKIEIDTDGIKNLESQVSKQVRKMTGNNSVGNIKIGADVDARSFANAENAAKKHNERMQNMFNTNTFKNNQEKALYLAKQAKKNAVALSKMEASAGKYTETQKQRVGEHLKGYLDQIEEIGNLSGKTKAQIKKMWADIPDVIGVNEAKITDLGIADAAKRETAQAQAEFKQLRASMKEMYSLQKDLVKLDKNSNEYKDVKNRLDNVTQANDKMFLDSYQKFDDNMFRQLAEDADNASASFSRAEAKAKDVHDAMTQKNEASIRKLETAKKQFELKSNNWLKNNSAAADEFGQRIEVLNQRMKSAKTDVDYKNVIDDFNTLKLEAEAAGKAHLTFWDGLKNQARQYASYVGVAGVAMAGGQAMRMMAQNVLEVDTAMTGLYRVTDLTSQQYDELYDKMVSSSKEYGRTLTDTINATSDWVRAGFDETTALGLADITAMYQNVSDLDYDEATKNILTSYKGFEDDFVKNFGGDAVAAGEHIVDVLNKLDNEFSVTSAGLGEGLARSASALEIAGNTFEESAA